MKWWTNRNPIPYSNESFNRIIKSFVFECPSVTRNNGKADKKSKGKKKAVGQINSVSAREGVSFKSRGVTGDKLNTILAKIKQPLVRNNSYLVTDSKGNVESEVSNMIATTTLTDPYFELIVFKERYEMPKTEALYYYIRNAFAHGSFEVIKFEGKLIYLLESAKGNDVKARMRLKESTLHEYIRLSQLNVKEIKALQKQKK